MNKKRLIAATVAAGMGFTAAQAEHERETSFERGRVLDVTPIYQVVQVPDRREVCYEEEVRYQRGRAAPTIIGAVIGGAVGNQVGSGNGRRAATAAGAAIGAVVGHEHSKKRSRSVGRVETYCEVVDDYREEERISGYRVDYEYNGQVYTTRTRRDPGQYIDLRVQVTPVSP